MLAFSEALTEELRGSGVTVTALCPPPVKTPFVQQAHIASGNYMATTEVTAAEVASYGYRTMKHGKPVAVYSLRYKLLSAFLEDYAALWPASAARPPERSGCLSIWTRPSRRSQLKAVGDPYRQTARHNACHARRAVASPKAAISRPA